MQSHKELKRIITEHNLVSHLDHIIAVKNGWTDLRFTNLDKKLTSESKYFLTLNIDDSSHILYYDNLLDLRQEINECMIKREIFKGYDKRNNRVHVHYEGDGIFRFGNINGGSALRKQFELCSLSELARRKDYSYYINLLPSNERHRAIQVLLAELGIDLGYSVKFAKNDESTILKNNPSLPLMGKLLDIWSLNLNTLEEKDIKNVIDRIDILWCDPLNNRIIAAFEVERSRRYGDLFERFTSLIEHTSYPVYYIVVGNDFMNFRNRSSRSPWKNIFSNHDLGYLTLDSLFEFLQAHKFLGNYIDPLILHKKFFNEKIYYKL